MSIFKTTPVYEAAEVTTGEENVYVEATVEAGIELALESYAAISKIIGGLYVADSMTTSKVCEGSCTLEEATVTLEATFKEVVTALKNRLIEFKNKLVIWFKKMVEKVKAAFMSSEKFVAQYKKEILERAKTAEVTYKGYEGITLAKFDTIDEVLGKFFKLAYDISDVSATDEKKIAETEEGIEKFRKAADEAFKKLREDRDEIKVTAAMVGDMVEFIEGYKKRLSAVEKNRDDMVNYINRTIKSLDRIAAKEDEIESKAHITKSISLINNINAAMQSTVSKSLSVLGAFHGQAIRVIRKVYASGNKKAAKESVETPEETGESLLEAAMKLF